MARTKSVSSEELETLSTKVTPATKEKVARIAKKDGGKKPGVWLRDHLDNLKE